MERKMDVKEATQTNHFLKLRAEVFKITASIRPRTNDPPHGEPYSKELLNTSSILDREQIISAVYTQQLVLLLNSVRKLIQVGSVIYK